MAASLKRALAGAPPLLLILLADGLRLYRLAEPSFWWDEGYSAFLAGRGLAEITARSAADIHPPLYYYVLHWWVALVGQTEFALRYFALAAGLLLVALLYRLAVRLFGQAAGVATALLAVLSPFYLAYSQEARMYTLEVVLALLAAGAAWSLLAHPAPRRSWWLWGAYVACSAAALYVDYFPVLVVVFVNVFAVLQIAWLIASRQPWRALALAWGAAQLAVVALYLPWLGIGLGQIGGYGFARSTAPDAAGYLVALWTAYNAGAAVPSARVAPFLLAVPAILLAGLAVHLWRRQAPTARFLFVLLYALVPALALALALHYRPFFHVRYLLVATPGYYLLLGLALGALWRANRPLGVLAWLPLLAAAAVGTQSYFFDPTFAKDDTRAAARFLAAETRPDDLVLWETPYPFAYYYHGPARAEGWPVGNPEAAVASLNDLAAGRQRVFWQTWYQGDGDPWGVVPFLLEKHGRPVGRRAFPGYQLAWYELPPGVRFTLAPLVPGAVSFEERVVLRGAAFGYPAGGETLPADRRPWVMLQWHAAAPGPEPLKFFVHVRDGAGHLVGQADGPLLDGRGAPTPYWAAETTALSFANPLLLAGLPPGRYGLEVGVYEATTGRRVGVVGGRTSVHGLGELAVSRPAVPPTVAGVGAPPLPVGWRTAAAELLGLAPPGTQEVAPGDTVGLTLFWRAADHLASAGHAVLLLRPAGGGEALSRTAVPPVASYPSAEWRPGEVVRQMADYRIGPEVAEGTYRLVLRLEESPEAKPPEVDITELRVKGRARSYDLPAAARPVGARFANGIELAAYATAPEAVAPGAPLALTLFWRAPGPSETSWTVFAHLLDQGNRVSGQHDGLPAGGQAPTTGWSKGEVVADRHEFAVKEGLAEGEYELEVGLYDGRSGERLKLVDGGDRVVLGKLTVRR